MTTKNWVIVLMISVLVGASCSYLVSVLNKPKFAFIDTKKIFNEFQLKKDLEQKLSAETKRRSKEIDSLKMQLQYKYEEAAKKKNPVLVQEFNFAENAFYKRESQYKEEIRSISDEYTQQTWKQLNQLIKEYGKQSGIKYIFGSKGEGDLFFAPDSEDMTLEAIKFVNAKYKGE